MADAARDGNNVPTLIAVSSADGSTPTRVYANPTTHRLLVESSTVVNQAVLVDGTQTASTNIYTVPTGKNFIVTQVSVELVTSVGFSGDFTFNVSGPNGSFTGPITTASLTTSGTYLLVDTVNVGASGTAVAYMTAGEVVSVAVTGASATTYSVRFRIIGYQF